MTQQQLSQSVTEFWQQVQTRAPAYWSELLRIAHENIMATWFVSTIMMIIGCLVIRKIAHDGFGVGSALLLIFFFGIGVAGMILIH
jgi:hypothetical protein